MKLLFSAYLVFCFFLGPNLSYAKVYKCKTNNGVKYQSIACENEKEKQKIDNSRILDSHGAYSKSINAHIYSIEEVEKSWQCNTLEQAFTSLPSRLSISDVLDDYSKMSKEKLAQKTKITYHRGKAQGKVAVRSSYSQNPCAFKLNTTIRSNFKSIILTIDSKKLPRSAHDSLSEEKVISLLKKNGYILQRGVSKNSNTNYHSASWKNQKGNCKASIFFFRNSINQIRSIKFSTQCGKFVS